MTLFEAFQSIKTKQEFYAFMDDLCTASERRYLNERWRIAQLLFEKRLSQKDIAKKNQFGIATITRVSKCLFENPNSGYKMILERANGAPAKK